MIELYNDSAFACSKLITKKFSTSFSIGVRLLDKKFRPAIYAIYGFVRYADEIVDTFFEQDQKYWLEKFRKDTYESIAKGFSFNPVLHSFQAVVNHYHIDHELIESFLKSMEMDLYHKEYDKGGFQDYVYGSAEVVGLMCLQVFTYEKGNYQELVYYARKLGEAFQKINFLRDLKDDYIDRGRSYFPQVDMIRFDDRTKQELEKDIQHDFDESLIGIRKLPTDSRFGVYIAYFYYIHLFKKIRKIKAEDLVRHRSRISNAKKLYLVVAAYFNHLIRKY